MEAIRKMTLMPAQRLYASVSAMRAVGALAVLARMRTLRSLTQRTVVIARPIESQRSRLLGFQHVIVNGVSVSRTGEQSRASHRESDTAEGTTMTDSSAILPPLSPRLPGLASASVSSGSPRGSERPGELLYVGTYTEVAGLKGIYLVPWTAAPDNSASRLGGRRREPVVLAIHPNGRVLYAVNELEQYNGRPSGAVERFSRLQGYRRGHPTERAAV